MSRPARSLLSSSIMLSRAFTVSLMGVDGIVVTVEAEIGNGLPCLTVVGQCSGALTEARERVRSAMRHCGHEIPARRQVVNLAPADRRKDSPGSDMAVACALLAAHGVLSADALEGTVFWAELGLDGTLRPVIGTLVVAHVGRDAGFSRIVVCHDAAQEARLIPGLEVVACGSLRDYVAHARGEAQPEQSEVSSRRAVKRPERARVDGDEDLDMADVRGLVQARTGLEVMVAGGHNMLLHGPPGVGKTMLARRARGLFPPLDRERALEVTKIHGVAFSSKYQPGRLIERAPLRMPHHTVSCAGLLGGGSPVRPGEVSLAHSGLLFLDELPEFSRPCIEGLREPIESGDVTLVRARQAVTFQAQFQLLAAMNPCPCGYHGHPERCCTCSPQSVARYQRKVSGPFMDRMDIVVPVRPTPNEQLARAEAGETSAMIRARVEHARAIQRARYVDSPYRCNARVPAVAGAMERHCPLTAEAEALLASAGRARGLSPRAMHRVVRVARTISDLGHGDPTAKPSVDAPRSSISRACIALALQLRQLPESGRAPILDSTSDAL